MILVTGATGLVGSHLLWQLLQDEEHVVAIRRQSSNLDALYYVFSFYTENPQPYIDKIEWRLADVLDTASIHKAMENINVVYHCAAVVSLGNNENSMLETNVKGTINIIEAALHAGVDKLCFVSSIAACGSAANSDLIDEGTSWKYNAHRTAYSQSKYLSEQEVWKATNQGLKTVIVNPGVILGVSANSSGSSQLFTQVKKGLPFFSYGGSGYVDVRDVARAMIQLTKSEISGERFILVSENCSNKEILTLMAKGFGKRPPQLGIAKSLLMAIGFLSEIAGSIFHFSPVIDRSTARSISHRSYYSSRKIQETIGFKFAPISQCVNEVCEFLVIKKRRQDPTLNSAFYN